jgi:hypothetical protein
MWAMSLVRFMANDCNFMSRSSGLQKMITRPAGRILHSDKPCATLRRGRAALNLLCADPIHYPFIKVGPPDNTLNPGNPHVVSDSVAHARESDGDTSVF